MSNLCNTCQKPINWNITRREEFGIKGALNPDAPMSIHRCYSEHESGSTKESKSDITLLQEISRLLNELIDSKAPKKVYIGE